MSITSANSIFTLTLTDLYPIPQVLQGFAVDESFDLDELEVSESVMGVDGIMSSGYVPNISKMKIAFAADSPSIAVFEYWLGAMQTAREISKAQGTILLPGTGKSYVLTNGVLQAAKQIPAGKKILGPQSFTVAWNSVRPAVV